MKRPKFATGYRAVFSLVEKFLEAMKQKGLNRADLARLADVRPPTVTKWFAPGRNLSVFTAAMIAEALGMRLGFTLTPKRQAAALTESRPSAPAVDPSKLTLGPVEQLLTFYAASTAKNPLLSGDYTAQLGNSLFANPDRIVIQPLLGQIYFMGIVGGFVSVHQPPLHEEPPPESTEVKAPEIQLALVA